jgi:hypothetical protein
MESRTHTSSLISSSEGYSTELSSTALRKSRLADLRLISMCIVFIYMHLVGAYAFHIILAMSDRVQWSLVMACHFG